MRSPSAALEVEPGSGELFNCNYYYCEVVGKTSENKVQLCCCMICINIKGFSFYFWFPTDKKVKSWVDIHYRYILNLKWPVTCKWERKFASPLLSPYPPMPVQPSQKKNWDFIQLGIKSAFIVESYYRLSVLESE